MNIKKEIVRVEHHVNDSEERSSKWWRSGVVNEHGDIIIDAPILGEAICVVIDEDENGLCFGMLAPAEAASAATRARSQSFGPKMLGRLLRFQGKNKGGSFHWRGGKK